MSWVSRLACRRRTRQRGAQLRSETVRSMVDPLGPRRGQLNVKSACAARCDVMSVTHHHDSGKWVGRNHLRLLVWQVFKSSVT